MNSKADKLREKGEALREQDQHGEALQALDQALLKAQEEKNYEVLVDVLKARCLTWKHLFLLSGSQAMLILAQKAAEAMLEVTEKYDLKEKFHTSYFRLGEIAMLDNEYTQAAEWYRKALETFRGPASERGDYRYHLGEALYKNGEKKKGLEEFKKGIKEIEKGARETDRFLVNVWLSGAHMRLVELLQADDTKRAKQHAQKAQEIIDADERLVIRKRQLGELRSKTGL